MLVEKSGSTSQFRRYLQNQARAGNLPVVMLSRKGGTKARIGVEVNGTVRVLSDTFPRQFKALRWLIAKVGHRKPKTIYEAGLKEAA